MSQLRDVIPQLQLALKSNKYLWQSFSCKNPKGIVAILIIDSDRAVLRPYALECDDWSQAGIGGSSDGPMRLADLAQPAEASLIDLMNVSGRLWAVGRDPGRLISDVQSNGR